MMQSLGFSLTTEEVQDMIAEADTDEKGAIDFPEYLTLFYRKMSDVDPEMEYAEIFTTIDKNNNGIVTWQELREFMKEIGEYDPEIGKGDEFVKNIIGDADVDEDGGLDFTEFCYMMMCR